MFTDIFFDWFTLMRDGLGEEKKRGSAEKERHKRGREESKAPFFQWKWHRHTSKQLKTTPRQSVNTFGEFGLFLL